MGPVKWGHLHLSAISPSPELQCCPPPPLPPPLPPPPSSHNITFSMLSQNLIFLWTKCYILIQPWACSVPLFIFLNKSWDRDKWPEAARNHRDHWVEKEEEDKKAVLWTGLARAAVIKYHRPPGFNNRHLFSHSSGTHTSKTGQFLLSTTFLACYLFTVASHGRKRSKGSSWGLWLQDTNLGKPTHIQPITKLLSH